MMNDSTNPLIKRRTTVTEILNNDQDREQTYQKIVELFIAAGYFRARIQNIEPFDKILGGIAWTLTGCFYDIDIEFKDEMNLAEKIKVSEKITAGLKSVNCPFIINPVQLQGLDLPAIFQVLQWLVKKLLEIRDERNARNKKYALKYFETKCPQKTIAKSEDPLISAKYNYIHTGRMYRPITPHKFAYNDTLRIFFTLIEYGLNKDLAFQRQLIELLKKKNIIEDKKSHSQETNAMPQFHKSQTATPAVATSPHKEISKEEIKILDEILSTNIKEVTPQNKNFTRVNTMIIETIFSENIDTIISEIDNYDNLKGDETIDRIKLFLKEKERLENNKINIVNQINEYEADLDLISSRVEDNNGEISRAYEEIQKLTNTLQENKMNIVKLNEKVKEAKISEEKMRIIGEKIKQKEEIKLAITKFKKDCLEEKSMYDNQLEVLEKKIQKMNDSENTQVFEEIDRSYQVEYEKTFNKKKDLFEQNKIINLLTRKIQVFPSKLELIQYQKRFQELYDQINYISEKSRKLLGDCNAKDEVVSLLNQKLEIFLQLKDFYKSAKSKKDREDFKENLNSVLNSLQESLKRSSERLKQMNKSIEDNQAKLNELQLYENKYMKLIKEYSKEYNKFNKIYH